MWMDLFPKSCVTGTAEEAEYKRAAPHPLAIPAVASEESDDGRPVVAAMDADAHIGAAGEIVTGASALVINRHLHIIVVAGAFPPTERPGLVEGEVPPVAALHAQHLILSWTRQQAPVYALAAGGKKQRRRDRREQPR